MFDRGLDPGGVEAVAGEELWAGALVGERVREPPVEDRGRQRMWRQALADGARAAASGSVVAGGDEQFVRRRLMQAVVDVARLARAHVDHGGAEALGSLQGRGEAGAEGQDRDATALATPPSAS